MDGLDEIMITGVGAITPVGRTFDESWASLLAGRSGTRTIQRFDPSNLLCQVAGEVDEIPDVRTDMQGRERFRSVRLGAAAIEEALADAGLDDRSREQLGARLGFVCGTHGIALPLAEAVQEAAAPEYDPRIDAVGYPGLVLAEAFCSGGAALTISTACSSGAMALLEAARLIRSGVSDLVVAGGTDSITNEMTLVSFAKLGALSTYNDSASTACRPFDRTRTGFVMSEGAAFLVLESRRHAAARGARSRARLTGWGASVNTSHLAASSEDGSSQAVAMERALAVAGRSHEDVGYLNAHGTGTPDNDLSETLAIKRVFGPKSKSLAVSSTKGASGHLIAAAGAFEAAVCVRVLSAAVVPPTRNLLHADPACDLDYVADGPRPLATSTTMTNSFGLAGSNVSLVIEAP